MLKYDAKLSIFLNILVDTY